MKNGYKILWTDFALKELGKYNRIFRRKLDRKRTAKFSNKY
jgi:hypothetical protein